METEGFASSTGYTIGGIVLGVLAGVLAVVGGSAWIAVDAMERNRRADDQAQIASRTQPPEPAGWGGKRRTRRSRPRRGTRRV